MMKKTLWEMHRKQCFPDLLISFTDCRKGVLDFIAETGILLPPKMLILYNRAMSLRDIPVIPGFISFFTPTPQIKLWMSGYELLRERIFTPFSPPAHRFRKRILILDAEIPDYYPTLD